MDRRRYTCRVMSASGALQSRTVEAIDVADAVRHVTQLGMTVVDLQEQSAAAAAPETLREAHAILVLKQLAVMTRAGVGVLEALETVAASMPSAETPLRNAAQALRRGERVGAAMEAALPFYPRYVYGLIRAGEASGKLPQVLEDAAQQLAFEQRVKRDVLNALVYPGFLVVSGIASVCFLLYAVVPRFAEMLSNTGAPLTGFTKFVLDLGVAFAANAPAILAAFIALILGAWFLLRTSGARAALINAAHATPGLRTLAMARQQSAWTRVAALSLGAGVGILEAVHLAMGALPEGRLKGALAAAAPALRAGTPVDAAFQQAGAISPLDASLLRAGLTSGDLPAMFRVVADSHEDAFRDALKRFTLIIEPLAIALVALMVGAIVLSLASALVGIYENVGVGL